MHLTIRFYQGVIAAGKKRGTLDTTISLIKSIDTTRARALPGVFAVVTAEDLPRVKFGILPVSQDEEALCAEKVRMVGDPVAAVAAVDEETAEQACRLIEVDYEPLPAVVSRRSLTLM